MHFQHNKVPITWDSYKFVQDYKRQMLTNVTKLLNDHNIKFVICYGNLLEYERGKPIYRDDDIDIIFDVKDIKKWEYVCNSNNRRFTKYNLIFDTRFKNMKRQKINGIQCQLIKYENKENRKEYKMDIHCDIVASVVRNKFWPDLNIDFYNLRKVELYNVKTYAPSKLDTVRILTETYGPEYIIPNTRNPFKIYK